jgi:hypothetical protein
MPTRSLDVNPFWNFCVTPTVFDSASARSQTLPAMQRLGQGECFGLHAVDSRRGNALVDSGNGSEKRELSDEEAYSL